MSGGGELSYRGSSEGKIVGPETNRKEIQGRRFEKTKKNGLLATYQPVVLRRNLSEKRNFQGLWKKNLKELSKKRKEKIPKVGVLGA